MKKLESNTRLIITYSHLLKMLEELQNDVISSLGDSDNISLIPEKEIYNAVKNNEIKIME